MTRLHRHWVGVAVVGAMVALGCKDSFESTEPKAYVLPDTMLPRIPAEMTRTQRIEVGARVATDSSGGETITGTSVAWTTSDPAVVAVKRTSASRVELTATGLGQAVIVGSVSQGAGTVPQVWLVDTVAVHERWLAVSVGRSFACGINVDSTAYCWERGSQLQPVVVPGLFNFAVRNLEVGHSTACVLALVETPFCWGQNGLREMGLGEESSHPVAIQSFPGVVPGELTGLRAGGAYFCLDLDGIDGAFVSCYGSGAFRQLGEPTDTTTCAFDQNRFPCIHGFQDMDAWVLDAGENHACAFKRPFFPPPPDTVGVLLCWGADATGQLGPRQTTERCRAESFSLQTVACGDAEVVSSTLRFRAVSAGWDIYIDNASFEAFIPWLGEGHTCGITAAHLAYCWGKSNHGQLGPGADTLAPVCTRPFAAVEAGFEETTVCRPDPVEVPAPGPFEAISAGSEHTCGIIKEGTHHRIYCWGRNDDGQLGDSATTSRKTPALIASDREFQTVSAGPDVTCGLSRPEGAIFCWGEDLDPGVQRLKDPN